MKGEIGRCAVCGGIVFKEYTWNLEVHAFSVGIMIDSKRRDEKILLVEELKGNVLLHDTRAKEKEKAEGRSHAAALITRQHLFQDWVKINATECATLNTHLTLIFNLLENRVPYEGKKVAKNRRRMPSLPSKYIPQKEGENTAR